MISKIITFIVWLIYCFMVAFISMLLHEIGHAIFAIFNGFKVSSIEVWNLKICIKDKFKFKKINKRTFDGFCELTPDPNKKIKRINCILVMLGGVVINLIIALIFGSICFIYVYKHNYNIVNMKYEFLVLFPIFIVNMYFFLSNGLPLSLYIDEITSDGTTVYSLIKNKKTYLCLLENFKIHDLISEKKFYGLDKSLFDNIEKYDVSNKIFVGYYYTYYTYLICSKNFDEALKVLNKIKKYKYISKKSHFQLKCMEEWIGIVSNKKDSSDIVIEEKNKLYSKNEVEMKLYLLLIKGEKDDKEIKIQMKKILEHIQEKNEDVYKDYLRSIYSITEEYLKKAKK